MSKVAHESESPERSSCAICQRPADASSLWCGMCAGCADEDFDARSARELARDLLRSAEALEYAAEHGRDLPDSRVRVRELVAFSEGVYHPRFKEQQGMVRDRVLSEIDGCGEVLHAITRNGEAGRAREMADDTCTLLLARLARLMPDQADRVDRAAPLIKRLMLAHVKNLGGAGRRASQGREALREQLCEALGLPYASPSDRRKARRRRGE